MQTKKQSFIESLSNVAVGYLISLLSLFIIFPILGIESSTGKNLIITLYFTLISIARSYILRRYFNKKTNGSWHLDNSSKQDQTCSVDLWLELNDFEYAVTSNIFEGRKEKIKESTP